MDYQWDPTVQLLRLTVTDANREQYIRAIANQFNIKTEDRAQQPQLGLLKNEWFSGLFGSDTENIGGVASNSNRQTDQIENTRQPEQPPENPRTAPDQVIPQESARENNGMAPNFEPVPVANTNPHEPPPFYLSDIYDSKTLEYLKAQLGDDTFNYLENFPENIPYNTKMYILNNLFPYDASNRWFHYKNPTSDKTTVIIWPTYDYNGAFNSATDLLRPIVAKKDSSVVLTAAGSVPDLESILQRYPGKIDILDLNGHGDPESIKFGDGFRDSLTKEEIQTGSTLITILDEKLSSKATINSISCSMRIPV